MANKTASKPIIKVKLDIQPGTVTPAQRQAWRRFWRRLAASAKGEVQ